MKNVYKTPFTEVVDLNLHEKIEWSDGTNSNNNPYVQGKDDEGLEDEIIIIDEESWDYDLWGDN